MPIDKPVDPVALVGYFLEQMQARNIEAARACLHPSFSMVFPGNVRFTRLEELIAWARPRYQDIGKRIERCEVAGADGGTCVVWCFGTLHGRWPGGEAFDGIRFVDRFTVADGLLVSQQVWNDLAETLSMQA